MNEDDATIINEKPVLVSAKRSDASPSRTESTPVASPKIGVINAEDRSRFTSETEQLLRGRLKAAAIDLWVVLGLGLIGNSWVGNFNWLGLRLLIFGSIIGSYVLLKRIPNLRMASLRWIEAILFGGVAIQMSLMMYSRMAGLAAANDGVSMISAADFFVAAFCLHILTYGIFLPNSWKRAAVIMSIFAIIPYLIWFGLIYTHSDVARLAALNQASWPIPVPFIAALIGTWGSHIIHRTRREAYQARQILQYRLQAQIGRGGMGEVYQAEHILLKRPCAIKLIRTDRTVDDRTLKLFEKEVIAAARLSHWNSIDIYDYGHTEDGTFFYVMELLEGDSLQALIEQHGPLPPARVIWLMAQVCDALEEAHAAEMVHRDIKPANIFVTCRGGHWDVAKLLDFGLVKENRTESDSQQSSKGFSGTPAFMAPEQAFAYESVDFRADLYAVGSVAYYALTGRPPFVADTISDLLYANAVKEVVPPSKHVASIPADLDRVIVNCLAKDPFERYESAVELARWLRKCECVEDWSYEQASRWWSQQVV